MILRAASLNICLRNRNIILAACEFSSEYHCDMKEEEFKIIIMLFNFIFILHCLISTQSMKLQYLILLFCW